MHRKKTNYRLVESLSANRLLTALPKREGKNYYVRYKWENTTAADRLNHINQELQVNLDGAESVSSMRMIWGGEIDKEKFYNPEMIVILMERALAEISEAPKAELEIRSYSIQEVIDSYKEHLI